MSAERLARAAQELRERAEAANEGPWSVDRGWGEGYSVWAQGFNLGGGHGDLVKSDAAYIALMHPGLGLALADWLDNVSEQHARWYDDGLTRDALRVADVVLGGEDQ